MLYVNVYPSDFFAWKFQGDWCVNRLYKGRDSLR